ncbi:MAG TPA: bifunctional diaminohydroxyphosphoribosylaminopyrimidine deaminase/5-amino-6-(5-phosphoribosylamino)uracil reductase RibD, partial [Chthonomonadales bacterium]|nr:bifunctional diaminohydroxyphosphoribosylaminopyrimidine deaminase/5-amino-6-(5-phosphoribosylamino)uracil reductase RibD [Chthonomonadales bacterium]
VNPPAVAPAERRWMRAALRLAAKGFTAPNPMVGCIIVRNGAAVGTGYHLAAGRPHAEVEALRIAGAAAAGATVYVTLEPCCHWGRTGPCTSALIAAGVKRVVAAVVDPDPRVSGQGLRCLEDAGIETSCGLLEHEARQLNRAYFHYAAEMRPLVTLKAAISLDGKTATRTGDSRWITGESARRQVHRLRAQAGAVMVGVGTVLVDDPRLTARLPGARLPRQPLRVVVDSRLRTPLTSRVLQHSLGSDAQARTLIATTDSASAESALALEGAGAEILRTGQDENGHVDLALLLRELGRRGVISVLVEGGGRLHAGLLSRGLADRALFYIAPKLIGGKSAPTALEGAGAQRLAEAVVLSNMRCRRAGPDLAIEADIVR